MPSGMRVDPIENRAAVTVETGENVLVEGRGALDSGMRNDQQAPRPVTTARGVAIRIRMSVQRERVRT
jgi:hypothetical protein